MTRRIIWSTDARVDIRDLVTFISQNDADYADRVVGELEAVDAWLAAVKSPCLGVALWSVSASESRVAKRCWSFSTSSIRRAIGKTASGRSRLNRAEPQFPCALERDLERHLAGMVSRELERRDLERPRHDPEVR